MRFFFIGLFFIWRGIQAIAGGLQRGHSIDLDELIPLGIGAVLVFIGTLQIKKKGFFKTLLQKDGSEDAGGSDTKQPFPDLDTVKRAILEKRQQREAAKQQPAPQAPPPRPIQPRVQARQRTPQGTPRPFVDTLAEQRKEIARLKAEAQQIKKQAQAIKQSRQQPAYARPTVPPVVALREAFTDPAQLRMLLVAHEVFSFSPRGSTPGPGKGPVP